VRIAGLILLVVAPGVLCAQVVGPPVEPEGRSALRADPRLNDSEPAGARQTEPEAAAAPGRAQDAATSGAHGAAGSPRSANPPNESLPLGAASEALPLGSAGSQSRSAGGLGVGRTVISLAAVVAVAALLAAAYRQWAARHGGLAMAMGAGGRAPSGVLEVLGRYPVSRGLTLVLLKIDRRVLLLAQTRTGRFGTGVSLRALCEMSDPEEVASVIGRCRDEDGESLAGKFRSMLRQFEATDEELGELEGVDGEPLRLVQFSTDGDRAELWDVGEDGDVWDEDPYAQRGVG
jgi:hypothetical protein